MTSKQIKESLLLQLKIKGADIELFRSLVDDYIFYWQKERDLQKDVKKTGLRFLTWSASGHEIEKENPSVKAAVMYNKQKLAILKELNLTTGNCTNGEEDEL